MTRWSTWRQLAPAVGFYLAFFVAPLLILVVISFWSVRGFQLLPGFSLSNYIRGLTGDLYTVVLVRTIVVGVVTAVIVIPIAYVTAYLMCFVFSSRAQLIFSLVLVSMFTGYLVRIYAWRTILGKEGLLNSALQQMGLVHEPLTFLSYSNWAVVVILVQLLIPLALLPIYSSMSNVGREHVEVSRDLGARTLHLHRTVLIPMVLPGLSTAFAIVFVLAAGDFVVPEMAGGTAGLMIGNVIADQFKGSGANWPLGASLAILVICVTVPLTVFVSRATKFVTEQ